LDFLADIVAFLNGIVFDSVLVGFVTIAIVNSCTVIITTVVCAVVAVASLLLSSLSMSSNTLVNHGSTVVHIRRQTGRLERNSRVP
jgi:hypothetical protein